MYCPKCGTQNNDESVKFCRGCGEDLRLVAHALTKRESWHMSLVRKYDDYLESAQPKAAESAIVGGLMGSLLLLGGLISFKSSSGDSWLSIFTGCTMLILSLLEYGRYRRSFAKKSLEEKTEPRAKNDLSIYQPDSLPASKREKALPAKTTGELSTLRLQKQAAPPSVTEHTTKHLDSMNKRHIE